MMKVLRLTDDLAYRIAWARHVAAQGGDVTTAKGELADAVIAAVEATERRQRVAKLARCRPLPLKVDVVDARRTRRRA